MICPDPKSYQLQHFTRSFETLKLILKDHGGFWPRYSLEDFGWSHRDRMIRYLAVPCTCFCDLPMEANAMHRTDYGQYVIAFDKSSELAKKLTPLIYVNEDGPIAEMVRVKYGRFLSKFDPMVLLTGKTKHRQPKLLEQKELAGIWDFLPYMKSTLGHTLQHYDGKLRKGYNAVWSAKALEHEFEWRYVPQKYRDKIYCFEDYDEWSMDKLAELSEQTKDSFLTFSHDEVKSIVVRSEAEQGELVDKHPHFKSIVTTWEKIEASSMRYRYI